ncbi:MAG: molybdopterin-dependent oxidoreductase, partial [candidate division Zixibacteria bacterium]|nr:molybdopterin-dependent oxidoreductase [candidate division Zixibacteria bacterium]
DGWLANVTRYSHQVITSDERLQTPLIKKDGKQVEATWDQALDLIHRRFGEIKEKKGGVCIGGLAAPNLDNASLYSFGKFMRTVLNSNNLDFRQDYKRLPASESVFGALCRQEFKIADIDDSDVIVVFGSDMLREHPNEYVRMRKAYNFSGTSVFSINPYGVKSADIAQLQMVYEAGTDEAVVNGLCLAAIEENLVTQSAATDLLSKLTPKTCAEAAAASGVDIDALKTVVRALAEGRKITFVVGELVARSTGREIIAQALANLDRLLSLRSKGQLAVLARHANSVGAERLGLMPQPSESIRKELQSIWGRFPDGDAHNTDAMLALMKKEEIDGLFVLGANPIMLCPDRDFVQEGISKVDFMVACDLFETETTELADVVLPLSSWAEFEGAYVNLEGRQQVARKVLNPIGQSRPGYEIVAAIAERFEAPWFESAAQLTNECDQLLKIKPDTSLPDEFLKADPQQQTTTEEFPHPLYVVDDAHHAGHLSEKAPSLANVVGEAYIELSKETAARYKVTSGDPVRVESEVGKVIVPVRISKWIKNDALVIPRNFFATKTGELLKRKDRVDRVKISKVDE